MNKNLIDVAKRLNSDLIDTCGKVEVRINRDGVEAAISKAIEKFPAKKPYLLTDTSYDFPNQVTKIESLENIEVAGNAFVCVYYSDQQGVEVAKQIKDSGGFYFTPEQYEPVSHYLHKNDLARSIILSDFERANRESLSHFDWRDFANILQAVEMTKNIAGDILEVGVFRGTSSRTLLHYLSKSQIKKKCYFIDTFEGFNYSQARDSSDGHWADTHDDTSMVSVEERLSEFRPSVDFELIQANICSDDLPKELTQIALCNLDVDLYEAVLDGLNVIAPRMSHRGVLIVEDVGHTPALTGAQLAVDEFLESSLGRKFTPLYMESGQCFLIKVEV